MNTRLWLLVAAVTTPLGALSCTVTPGGTTGTGGATSTTTSTSDATSTTAATTASASSSSGAGGAGSCVGVFTAGACATCAEAACCAEGAKCDVTAGCLGCVYSSDPSCTTANKPAVDALLACMHTSCETACFPVPLSKTDVTCIVPTPTPSAGACVSIGGAIECNPVTNEPCDTVAGEACDFKGNGYHCYAAPNDVNLCAACGPTNGGSHCKGGSTCLPGPDGTCGKFCCADGDCGKGKCDKTDMFPAGVGYCLGGNP
jgi:hypothetical protein